MKIKRVLQGTALTALAAAALVGAGSVDASAATIPDGNITVNAAKQEMTVKTGDAEVLFGVGAFKNNGIKVSVWDVYDVESGKDVKIDLSKLNNTKDNYLVVKTEKTDPLYIKVPAAVKSQKVTYDPAACGLTITKIKVLNTSTDEANTYSWEYRTSYGNWDDFNINTEDLFKDYQYQGASLYVRAKAATNSSITATTGEAEVKVYDATKYKNADKAGTDVSVLYIAGSLPGKESKLNIKKIANGPSITADYVKREITLKDKTEYRVWTADKNNVYTITTDRTAGARGTKVSLTTLLKSASSGVIEVRTIADSAKKKAASKWTRIELKDAGTIALKENASIATEAAIVDVAGRITMGKHFKNNGKFDDKITVTVSTGSSITVTAGARKAVTINGDNTPKNITAKIGEEIKIAIAGNKKDKVWAGIDTTVCTLE